MPGDVGDVAAEEAVLADGDAVGFILVEAEVDAERLGLGDGLDVVDAVDHQRPLNVFFRVGTTCRRPLAVKGSFGTWQPRTEREAT